MVLLIFSSRRHLVFALLLPLLLSSCSSAGLALINTRAKLSSNHTLTSDIQYGEKPWQKLDLYIPKNDNQQTDINANLIFFYGGGWSDGSKEQYYFVASKFANLGYTVIVPDYVKFPQGKFPAFIEDGAQTIAWLKQNIHQYGGNTDNIFIAGHSAGAHLGALLLADSNYLNQVGAKPNDINGFAGLSGPYGFTPKAPRFVRIFEPPSNYPKMNVINYIDGDEPPMLLLHGEADRLVSIENMHSSVNKAIEVGGIANGIIYPNVSHVRLLLGITSKLIGNSDPSLDMDRFFRKHLTETNK